MKHLNEYISLNEATYQLPEEFYKEAGDIMKGVCGKLKQATSKSKLSTPQPERSNSWGGFKDQAKHIGMYGVEINYNFYGHKLKDIDMFKRVWNMVFKNQPVDESLFDNGSSQTMESLFDKDLAKKDAGGDEYDFIKGIYDCLCDIFKVKDLSTLKEPWDKDIAFAKAIKELPTFKEGSIYTTLTNVYCRFYGDNIPLIEINFEQYIEKDPEKVAAIKQENANLKPLDCMGREIRVGDTVAYAPTKYGGNSRFSSVSKALTSGVVTAVSKQQVTINSVKLYATGCCIVSRKDGKMIE